MSKNNKNGKNGNPSEKNIDSNFNQRLLEGMAGLEIEQEMSEAELSLTKKCVEIRKKLDNKEITVEERTQLEEELKKKRQELKEIRQRFDKAISIIDNIKTPCYTSDVNKRGNIKRNTIGIRSCWS